ncbi:DUF3300 domain-containing protein [Thalassotalea atypica]|uniref:DUF3300 domain-containing protein n=1 Tax=Thalassotalea atypica TaxID=2054316 RepID=UPI0025729961|nr:DUF3300 domain-containing protein [Thalassotalea atypica]
MVKVLLFLSLSFINVAHSRPLDTSVVNAGETQAGYANTSLSAEPTLNKVVYQEGELEQLLAPIALYPDTLLSHILIATTYPLEIVEAYRFRENYPSHTSEQIIELTKDKDWDPSVKALLPFTTVLKKLHDDLQWTQDLGNAFLASEKQVMASIQTLRTQAEEAGNLASMDNLDVSYDQEKIIIAPREKEIIYVPYYDTRIVYGHWPWRYYPPVHWHYTGHHYSYYNPYYWRTGVYISTAFYFSAIHWHNHYVAVDYAFHNYHRGYHSHHNKHHHDRYGHGKKHHIVKSGYAKQWQHKAHHRKGVSYRTNGVKTKHYAGYSKPHRYSDKHGVNANKHNLNKKRVLNTNKYAKTYNKSHKISKSDRRAIKTSEVKSYSNKHYASKTSYQKTIKQVNKTQPNSSNQYKNKAFALEKEPSKYRRGVNTTKQAKSYTSYKQNKERSTVVSKNNNYASNSKKYANSSNKALHAKVSKSNSSSKNYSKSSHHKSSKIYSRSSKANQNSSRSNKPSGRARKHK